jgi:hypothetical protein
MNLHRINRSLRNISSAGSKVKGIEIHNWRRQTMLFLIFGIATAIGAIALTTYSLLAPIDDRDQAYDNAYREVGYEAYQRTVDEGIF